MTWKEKKRKVLLNLLVQILNCTFRGFAKSVLVLNLSSFSDDLANIFIIIIIIKFLLLVL